MKTRHLGKNGPEVTVMGLGCMGMSEFYGETNDVESKLTILNALENGITMLDTADTYGNGHNEKIIGEALQEWHGDVFIATKFGIVRKPGRYERVIDGRPQYVREAADASLKRLNRDAIDLYYIHRVDHNIPIEETIGAMSDLVHEGKIRYIGVSEASPSTIRRAHSVHPLSAVQSEYSLWTRHYENELFPTLRQLGISFVAYSPLGRGFLTGKLNEVSKLKEGDFRKTNPRFQEENFVDNLKFIHRLEGLAKQKGITPAQLALAWVLSKGEDIFAIPGTKRRKYLMENISAAEIILTPEEIDKIESSLPAEMIKGERYTEEGMKGVDA